MRSEKVWKEDRNGKKGDGKKIKRARKGHGNYMERGKG